MSSSTLRSGRVRANEVDFAYLAAGDDGPLALCLHGFPDTAHGWRHLLPELAAAGYRAVAPFQRGYAPTAVPTDGHHQVGALVRDAVALHEALGGDGDAVLIGHDWGALAAYGAASFAPDRWRRVVAAAVPPGGAMGAGLMTYRQLKLSWYMFFFQMPFSDVVVGLDDLAFIEGLWADWSPGYDATEDLVHVKAALRDPAHLSAALGIYRATFQPELTTPDLAAEQAATGAIPPQPTLYLHGVDDGAIGVEWVGGVAEALSAGSRVEILDDAGHFLQLEQPRWFNDAVLSFLGEAGA